MNRVAAVLIVAILALTAGLGAAVDVTVTRLGGRSLGAASSLADQTEELLNEIKLKTGLSMDGPLSLVLCTDVQSFHGFLSSLPGGHDEVLGVYASPEIADGVPVIALNLELIESAGGRARGVYKHELCHAVLGYNLLARLRPLWFEEGLCQWVSETPFEAAARQAGFASGYGDDPRSLAHVSQMMRDPMQMGGGYAHGFAAVSMMISKHGEDGLRRLLAEMHRESSGGTSARIEEIYGRVFGASFGAFQDAFIESRRRTTFGQVFGFVGANMFPLSMLLAGILMLVAVARRRRRDRATLAAWREQDALSPPAPDWSYFMKPREMEPGSDKSPVELGETEFIDPAEEAMEEHERIRGMDEDWWRKGRPEE